MTPRRRAIVIAGPASGVGKTTIALGLMAAFRRRGLAVQPFKCGPDFIDAGHHTRVCERPSRNLDGWMLSSETNRTLFVEHAATADIAIVEGVMGLFDGARNSGEGSTAAMAKHLRLPVLFVVDASHMAASAAALVCGFETFDPSIRIAGVVFNQVGSAGHYSLLRDALEQAGCAPAVGYLPRDASLVIPERHLGLYTAHEDVLSTAALDHLSSLIEQHVDLDGVLEIATLEEAPHTAPASSPAVGETVRIAVARDRAFCFYYEDNLDALRGGGAEIVEFSPLTDHSLPEETNALYIGGGYPELYAAQLSANESMRTAVAQFVGSGGPTYAECGGLMYLGRHLRLQNGDDFAMVGILPFGTRVTERLVRFGYTEVAFTADCLLGRAGATARGHSFHYSTIDGVPDVPCAYRVRSTLSGIEGPEGYVVGNVLASYIHLHFLSNPDLTASFIRSARLSRLRAHTS
ncbi:MAG: cobyrinate a,c-diamide synthase [Acidobacteria bacterium]|nr:MAG: cobyrinate a,c-diamide synthase [Acidobacteriota bacterium]